MTKYYYENYSSEITKKGNYMVEEYFGEFRFSINSNIVNRIARATGQEPHLIAIIIAIVKMAKKDGTGMGRRPRLDMKGLEEILIILLECYFAEDLVSCFESLKWFEIKEIIESENPKGTFEEMSL